MKTRIWSAMFALYIAWGTTYLAIRIANETIPPFFMTSVRFLVAGVILYTWRRVAGDPTPTRQQWRSAAIIGSIMLVGGIGGVSLAEQHVPSGIAALIIAATPLWVVCIEAIRPGGHRPTWRTISGVLVGLAGIFILVNPYHAAGQRTGINLAGAGIVLFAALCWSIGSVYSRDADLPKSALLGAGMELLIGSAGSFITGLLLGEGRQLDLARISLRSLGGLGYLIVIGSLVAFVCYTWLLRVAPTNLVVTYTYVNPVVAIILGSLLAQEIINVRIIFAIPLILAAVALIHKREALEKPVPRATMVVPASAGED